MPKLNVTHLPERIQKRIEQLEAGQALEARDFESLLDDKQLEQYEKAWQAQQDLRAIHKPPKTEEKKKLLGWKTKAEVRLDIYRQALEEANDGLDEGLEELKQKSEVKAARVFMEAFSKAKDEDKNAWSAGNIALRRNGFNRIDGQNYGNGDKRSREMNAWEDGMREKMETDLSAEEKEQLELSREYEAAVAKRKKHI